MRFAFLSKEPRRLWQSTCAINFNRFSLLALCGCIALSVVRSTVLHIRSGHSVGTFDAQYDSKL